MENSYQKMLNQRTQFIWWQVGLLPKVPSCRTAAFRLSLYLLAKRCLDVFLSGLALVLLAPLMVLIAIAIKLDSPGPILHVQRRTGLGGRVFPFYKFRSMTNEDHAQEHRRFAESYISGQLVSASQADDGRVLYKPATSAHSVTRLGRWLRQTGLGELPQLFNVLKGDMSLVGPRPTIDYETALYTEHHRQRLTVLPGLTGWAQIHGRSGLSFDEIVALDLEYTAKRSFGLDARVLLTTIPVVLSAQHAG